MYAILVIIVVIAILFFIGAVHLTAAMLPLLYVVIAILVIVALVLYITGHFPGRRL